MLLFHICSTVKSSPYPFPLLSPYLPPYPSQPSSLHSLCCACYPSLSPLQHLAPSVAAHFLTLCVARLSFPPSYSFSFPLCLCLTLSPPSCVQFLYATKSPKCASHIVGYKLVARAEEHSRRLALEMRLSLLYH